VFDELLFTITFQPNDSVHRQFVSVLLKQHKLLRTKTESCVIYSDISCLFIRISSICEMFLVRRDSAVDQGLLRSTWTIPAGKETIMSPVIFSLHLNNQQHSITFSVSLMLIKTLSTDCELTGF